MTQPPMTRSHFHHNDLRFAYAHIARQPLAAIGRVLKDRDGRGHGTSPKR